MTRVTYVWLCLTYVWAMFGLCLGYVLPSRSSEAPTHDTCRPCWAVSGYVWAMFDLVDRLKRRPRLEPDAVAKPTTP